MSNSFPTTDLVALESAATLHDSLTAANLVNRKHEQKFGNAIGDKIEVKVPADVGNANEFTSTTSATDIIETSKDLELEKHFYHKIVLGPKELSLDLENFMVQVMDPTIKSIGKSIDSYFIEKIAAGFAPYLTGTAGTGPSTVQDIILGRKTVYDNGAKMDNLVSLISSTSEASFLQLNQFTSADFGVERPLALREASIGKAYGIEYFTSNVGTSSQGDVAGTVLLNGATAVGDTSIGMDAFTNATGTVKAGARFTIAGDTTKYAVVYDATKASNAATLTVEPPITQINADNSAITFETAHTQDVIYNPLGVAGAVVALAPLMGKDSSVQTAGNISVRITMDGSTDNMNNIMLVDVLAGCQVIQPKYGTVFQA